MKARLEDPFWFSQERQNRLQHANELVNIFKVVSKIEKEIRSA
jgi:hypothetical protein